MGMGLCSETTTCYNQFVDFRYKINSTIQEKWNKNTLKKLLSMLLCNDQS